MVRFRITVALAAALLALSCSEGPIRIIDVDYSTLAPASCGWFTAATEEGDGRVRVVWGGEQTMTKPDRQIDETTLELPNRDWQVMVESGEHLTTESACTDVFADGDAPRVDDRGLAVSGRLEFIELPDRIGQPATARLTDVRFENELRHSVTLDEVVIENPAFAIFAG